MSKHKHVIAKDARINGVDYSPLDNDGEIGETLTWDDVEGIVWLWQHDIPETDKPLPQLIEDAVNDTLKCIADST